MKTNRLFSLLLLAMAASFISCAPTQKEDPETTDSKDRAAMTEKNKIAMQKVVDAFNSGNADGLENYVSENMIDHQEDPNIKSKGLAGLKEAVALYHGAYPDMKMTVLSLVAEGDMVISHFNMKGTNSGPMGSMPATNKAIDVNGVDIVKFADGKGAEHWGYWEEGKMMTQLGMMPAMGEQKADTKKK
ncbi:MAG: ester cyclase [Bacteroidetes bacterium]|nr:ester cyclase [Bacteroidota bacterium]